MKLCAIGCYAASEPADPEDRSVSEFSPSEIDLMAEMEHGRWMAERYLVGWTLGPKGDRKKSPYLVPWKDLPESVRDYSRQAVRNIPSLLGMIGQRVYRLSSCGKERP